MRASVVSATLSPRLTAAMSAMVRPSPEIMMVMSDVSSRGEMLRMTENIAPVEGGRLLLEPGAEGPHIGQLSLLLRANECVAAARRQGQVEGHDETPRAQIVAGERIESEQHAGAFDRRVERVIGAIKSKAAADVGVLHAGRGKPVGPGRHDGAIVGPLTPG